MNRQDPSDSAAEPWQKICLMAPGLKVLTRYQPSWLSNVISAGLSVAAVAPPVGVPSTYRIYPAIFPLLTYARAQPSQYKAVNDSMGGKSQLVDLMVTVSSATYLIDLKKKVEL